MSGHHGNQKKLSPEEQAIRDAEELRAKERAAAERRLQAAYEKLRDM